MKFTEIAKLPTSVNRIHESVFRSYHVLAKVREFIDKGCSADVLGEIIDQMKSEPSVEETIDVQQ